MSQSNEPIDYRALFAQDLDSEMANNAYIDLMTPEELRAEMRALICMLNAERKITRELVKSLLDTTKFVEGLRE